MQKAWQWYVLNSMPKFSTRACRRVIQITLSPSLRLSTASKGEAWTCSISWRVYTQIAPKAGLVRRCGLSIRKIPNQRSSHTKMRWDSKLSERSMRNYSTVQQPWNECILVSGCSLQKKYRLKKVLNEMGVYDLKEVVLKEQSFQLEDIPLYV